jgi:hypothetical protein
MLATPWSRATNGKGLFELEQRKTLVRSTEMRWRGVIWWRNCCVKMEEKQNGREKLREGQWWKPHGGWPYRIRKYIWSVNERWEIKICIGTIYTQTNQDFAIQIPYQRKNQSWALTIWSVSFFVVWPRSRYFLYIIFQQINSAHKFFCEAFFVHWIFFFKKKTTDKILKRMNFF